MKTLGTGLRQAESDKRRSPSEVNDTLKHNIEPPAVTKHLSTVDRKSLSNTSATV